MISAAGSIHTHDNIVMVSYMGLCCNGSSVLSEHYFHSAFFALHEAPVSFQAQRDVLHS